MACSTAVIAVYHIVHRPGGTDCTIVVLESWSVLTFEQGAWLWRLNGLGLCSKGCTSLHRNLQSIEVRLMCFKAFLDFVQATCYHSDRLGYWAPGFGYIPEESSGMGRIGYDLTHSFLLVSKLLHNSNVCDGLALGHLVIFVFCPDDAYFAWVSQLIFVDEYVPHFACDIGIIDCSLELRCNAK